MGLCSSKQDVETTHLNKKYNYGSSSSEGSIPGAFKQESLKARRGVSVKCVKIDARDVVPPRWWTGLDKPVKSAKWKERIALHVRRRERKFFLLVLEKKQQHSAKKIQRWWRRCCH
eukprot:TRINITY_DN687_c0_g3_i1.p1 TRINITY_DN687_c0_g3~~TRINITY_DN687_c0_g3_i1.p1  ORF type:complete len:116 (+),score=14.05 TRINITY_DN687_c0_g3_i1:55-402(+)